MKHALANALGLAALLRRLGDGFEFGGPQGRWPRRRRGQPLLILPYHRVAPEPDDLLLKPVHPSTFEAQISHLAAYYRVLPLEAALDQLYAGSLPPRAVAITFDDGYRDNHAYAYPILKKHGVPATVFLATDFIGTGRIPPHDEIALAVRRSRVLAARLLWRDRVADLRLDSETARRAAIEQLTGWCRAAGADETVELIARLRAVTESPDDPPPGVMLTWDEVRAMAGGVVAFGSHGCSHVACAALSLERREAELREAKARIESELSRPVRVYAYPFGKPSDIGPEAPAAVRRAGYDYALTTVGRPAGPRGDRYLIPRGGPVWETRQAAFALRMAHQRLQAAD